MHKKYSTSPLYVTKKWKLEQLRLRMTYITKKEQNIQMKSLKYMVNHTNFQGKEHKGKQRKDKKTKMTNR